MCMFLVSWSIRGLARMSVSASMSQCHVWCYGTGGAGVGWGGDVHVLKNMHTWVWLPCLMLRNRWGWVKPVKSCADSLRNFCPEKNAVPKMLAAVAKRAKRTLFDEPYISLASSSDKSKNKKPKNTQFLQVCIRNSGWKYLQTHGPLGTMSPFRVGFLLSQSMSFNCVFSLWRKTSGNSQHIEGCRYFL